MAGLQRKAVRKKSLMNGLDQTLFLWLNLPQTAPHWAVKLAVFGGTSLLPLLVAATLAAALVGRQPWRAQAWRGLLAIVLASAATWLLKHGLNMPRPGALGLGVQWLQHSRIQGMPSSHAAVAAAWVGVAFMLPGAKPWLRVLFLAVALYVGWCRVALGLHFPFQVLAGWVLGVVCAGVAQLGTAAWVRRSDPRLSGHE